MATTPTIVKGLMAMKAEVIAETEKRAGRPQLIQQNDLEDRFSRASKEELDRFAPIRVKKKESVVGRFVDAWSERLNSEGVMIIEALPIKGGSRRILVGLPDEVTAVLEYKEQGDRTQILVDETEGKRNQPCFSFCGPGRDCSNKNFIAGLLIVEDFICKGKVTVSPAKALRLAEDVIFDNESGINTIEVSVTDESSLIVNMDQGDRAVEISLNGVITLPTPEKGVSEEKLEKLLLGFTEKFIRELKDLMEKAENE